MKKICIVSQYFTPDVGGAITRLNNILKALNDIDLEIFVITAVPHYPHSIIPQKYRNKRVFIEKKGKMNIIRLRINSRPQNTFTNRFFTYISFLWMNLFALFLIPKVDLIWVTSPNFFGNITGAVYKTIKRTPVILNIDDLWPDVVIELGFLKNRFLIWFANQVNFITYHYCDKITPISSSIKKGIIERYKINSEKIQVIEVGIDTGSFQQKIHEISTRMNSKNIAIIDEYIDKTNLLIYSGVLGPAYDFELLLKTAKFLERQQVKFTMLIQGEGELNKYINKRIGKLELQRVKLLNFTLDNDIHLFLLLKAKILLLPMKRGVFASTAIPAKLFTYLMTGKPIIATKGTEIDEILRESSSGLSIAHNPELIANTIKLLMTDNELYSKYENNGLEFVISNYSIDKIRHKVEKLLETMIG